MQAKYASFDSYEDKGTVTTIAPDWPGSKITFATHFRRPAFFRFEWDHDFRDRRGRKRTTHHLILSDGMFAYWCDENVPPKREKCLILLIAGATGVSLSAAYDVPGMLLPEVGGFLPADLERLVFRRTTLQS